MSRAMVFVVVGWLFCSLPVEAQISTGNIIGVVRDESGAVLPGVTATITSPALPAGPVTAVTNEQGEYRFIRLDPGVYALNIAIAGFSSYSEADLRVAVGGTTERNVTLKVAAVAETITVSGQAPTIDTRQTGIAKSLPSDVVNNVPHQRYGIHAFMATLPGVSANFNFMLPMNVMGSQQNETSYMIDGVMSNNPSSGNAWAIGDADGFEELSVTTLGASAEYQQAQGGVLNAVGKAGTDQFRIDGSGYWAPDALASKPIKLDCDCPEGQTGFKRYRFIDGSGHVGGPIVRGRAWFFTGLTFRGQTFRNPGESEVPKEFQYLTYLGDTSHKVNVKISDSVSFKQTYYYEWNDEKIPSFPTPANPLETILRFINPAPHWGSELAATLSSSTVLTARYSLNYVIDDRYGFFKDLSTPPRSDSFTGIMCCNVNPFRAHPRRDEVAVKLNTYRSGARVNQNISVGAQFAVNKDFVRLIVPGGVEYSDFNGAPDLATFTPPGVQAARFNAQGLWGEDEINIGQRFTFKVGARFDRMAASSPDAPMIDGQYGDTGQTVQGLGHMFTWTKVSPRVGANLKLTKDDKTVLRVTAGRYYRKIFLNDFTNVHPGTALSTLTQYNPVTRAYDRIIAVTDPRANIAVDPDMDAPYTDQYSIGVDREVARNLGFSVSYVRKQSKGQIGWKDIGGVYGARTVTASTGQTLTVFDLLNDPSARKFLRTNGPGFFSRYNGLILQLSRRYANRLMASIGYTYSIAEGLQPTGNTGRDPNDLVNLTGRFNFDRPHMLTLVGSYEIPKVEVMFSGNLAVTQGYAYAPQVQVSLPQGRRSINVDAPGSYRTPNESHLYLRLTKILFRNQFRRLEITGEIRNALQETHHTTVISRVLTSPFFGQQGEWPQPRQLLLLAKVYF